MGDTNMGDTVTAAAKTLARWCYDRGIDERMLTSGEQALGHAVKHALGRRAARHLEHALWQQVARLLVQRRAWDTAHHVTSPPTAECLCCAIDRTQCPKHGHATRRCGACVGPMPDSIATEGYDTHPCCDPSVSASSYSDLESVTRMLGATLLPQPAEAIVNAPGGQRTR